MEKEKSMKQILVTDNTTMKMENKKKKAKKLKD